MEYVRAARQKDGKGKFEYRIQSPAYELHLVINWPIVLLRGSTGFLRGTG